MSQRRRVDFTLHPSPIVPAALSPVAFARRERERHSDSTGEIGPMHYAIQWARPSRPASAKRVVGKAGAFRIETGVCTDER